MHTRQQTTLARLRGHVLAFTLAGVAGAAAAAPPADPVPPGADVLHDAGAGPDEGAAEHRPDPFQGAWRLVARDDRGDAALMALEIRLDAGARRGDGGYVLHQPFCDAAAGQPITGVSDCEFIGLGGEFDEVRRQGRRLHLQFAPGADGLPHRLVLRRTREGLAGDYLAPGEAALPVLAQRSPGAD